MEKHAIEIKAFIASIGAFLTALWGWFGWLCLALAGLMLLDYITGTRAAKKNNEWASNKARDGIAHKAIMFIVVSGAGAFDFVLGVLINNIPGIQLPFNYSVAFCPLVVVWYIITELGSLLENAVAAGAPIPPFLMPVIKGMKAAMIKKGKELTSTEDEEKE